ncbi:MAG TPA: chemotaxis protein CheX [Phycisphaerae bacterium]|jgi:chemotaxis protein CheX|nr:chemotaxis protein CheX [Phycisphaerae bacterium]
MAATKVHVGKPYRKTDPTATHDVSGIIGFSGNFVGSMVLTFKRDTALALASAFAGAEISPDSPDFADAVGELANMIAGAAKKNFSGTFITVPSVVLGAGHIIARLQHVPCVVVPCETAVGTFAVEVNVKSMKQGSVQEPH